MKAISFAILSALAVTPVMADRSDSDAGNQGRNSRGTITVVVDGLVCSTTAGAGSFFAGSWSWGAANSGSSIGSGGGAGRVEIADLTLKKAFDACSSALFRAVATGTHYRSLSLTQRDGAGNAVAVVDLSDVLVTSWTVGGSARDATPNENVSFNFTEACVSGSGSARICYDVRLGRIS